MNEGWMNANEEKNKELKTPSSLASNVLYNETEYFAFPNIWLIILFVYVVVYPVTINTTIPILIITIVTTNIFHCSFMVLCVKQLSLVSIKSKE